MAYDGRKNLIPFDKMPKEEVAELGRKGGIASGEARRKKATMKATLEMLLDETNKHGKTYRDLATLGLIKGAISGNAQCYRTILETLGELKQAQEDKTQRELSKVEELLLKIEEDSNK